MYNIESKRNSHHGCKHSQTKIIYYIYTWPKLNVLFVLCVYVGNGDASLYY